MDDVPQRRAEDFGEITLGEVVRRVETRLDIMQRDMDKQFMSMSVDLASHVQVGVYEAEKKKWLGDIAELKDTVKWIARSVGGLIIAAIGFQLFQASGG